MLNSYLPGHFLVLIKYSDDLTHLNLLCPNVALKYPQYEDCTYYLCSDIIVKVVRVCVNNTACVCLPGRLTKLRWLKSKSCNNTDRSLKTDCMEWHRGEKLPPDKHWLLNICFMTDPWERPELPSMPAVTALHCTAQQRLSDRAN